MTILDDRDAGESALGVGTRADVREPPPPRSGLCVAAVVDVGSAAADLTRCTDAQLADGICTWSARVAAGEATLLRLIAEFDRREAWSGPGMLSCAHWLVWRTGLGAGAARERVRVAQRLQQLPEVANAFDGGRMSWSQVRAISRVAAPDDGVDWVDLARHSSGAQLEKIVRGIRRVETIKAREDDGEQAAYRMRTRTRYADDGSLVITVYADAEDGAVILAGLEAERARIEAERAQAHTPATMCAEVDGEPAARGDDVPAGTSSPPDGGTPAPAPTAEVRTSEPADGLAQVSSQRPAAEQAPPSAPVTDAEALLAMAGRALDRQQRQRPASERRGRSRLSAQIDPLTGWARLADGELVPPGELSSLLLTAPAAGVVRLRRLTDHDLTRHDLGRRTRQVSVALRELLGQLDGERCRFPGCTRHRWLHAHHVRFWSREGPTDLANLVLLCSRHHTVVHRDGFALQLGPDRRLTVASADGEPVAHHPERRPAMAASLDRAQRARPGDLAPTDVTGRMDLGYVVGVLLQQAA